MNGEYIYGVIRYFQEDKNKIEALKEYEGKMYGDEIFRVIHQQPLKTKYKYNYKNLSQITIG